MYKKEDISNKNKYLYTISSLFISHSIIRIVSKWVSDCCLILNEQFFSYKCISWQEQVIFCEMTMMSALYLTNRLGWNFTLLAHCNNKHVTPLRHIILIPSHKCWFIVCSLTRPGLKVIINHIDNHYTTDSVNSR